jgi:hypothetical protein
MKKVTGPLNAVPCPFCGDASDLTDLRDRITDMFDEDQDVTITCDGCRRSFKIVDLKTTTIVVVEG